MWRDECRPLVQRARLSLDQRHRVRVSARERCPRLRVERQCGYKNLKFVKSIRVVDSLAGIGKGTGGINSDVGFHWFAGV